ncbi:hypothetical protein ACTGUS_00005, partial [Streptococcus suis]
MWEIEEGISDRNRGKTNKELPIVKPTLILFKKQKLTYNRFMKLTIEQTKELKTYLKDKTYSPFHRRL